MGELLTGNPGNGSGTSITLPATVENIGKITAFVEGRMEEKDCPLKQIMQVSMAVDEVMANVAMYAYAPGTGDVTVAVDFDDGSRTVSITFIDRGVAFDPLAKEDPDVTLPAEQRKIGGLGIFLVKKTMDDVAYRREGDKNVLCIKKKV
jgi:anti-sigma regulatory factor (Ser/Thr protein kinase)